MLDSDEERAGGGRKLDGVVAVRRSDEHARVEGRAIAAHAQEDGPAPARKEGGAHEHALRPRPSLGRIEVIELLPHEVDRDITRVWRNVRRLAHGAHVLAHVLFPRQEP